MMKNQSKHLGKTISTLSLGAILLISAPLVAADNNSANQLKNKPIESVKSVKQKVVNLNNSSIDQLVSLKGIGHTKARAIIAYRKQIGGFKSIKELSKVSGIGEKIVKDNISRIAI
jgi:competence protein ComEA